MNFYPFHVGDYMSATSHLTPMEDLAYRRLLDLYYLSEKMLPFDAPECARLIRMREHEKTVADILSEFFSPVDNLGWRHTRCESELTAMVDKRTKARTSAQRSVEVRAANAKRALELSTTDVQLPIPIPIKRTRASAPVVNNFQKQEQFAITVPSKLAAETEAYLRTQAEHKAQCDREREARKAVG